MVDIRVSPDRLRAVAHELDRYRSGVNKNLSGAKKTVADLAGEWAGLAQIDYTQMFNDEIQPLQNRIDEILEQLTNNIHRIADTFEETDRGVI